MKIRNDFVSNSSSSSYIIESFDDEKLKSFIETACESDPEYSDRSKKYIREFLDENLGNNCKYVMPIIGTFDTIGSDDPQYAGSSDWIGSSIMSYCIAKKEDMSKIIENGKPKFDEPGEFVKKYSSILIYPGYNVYEITQDTIDLSRWMLSKSKHKNNDPDIKAFDEFCASTRKADTEMSESDRSKINQKFDEHYEKNVGKFVFYGLDNIDRKDDPVTQLPKILNDLEKDLKAGRRIYRICFGYSGEGEDWDSYIYTDNLGKVVKGDSNAKFTYDWQW